MPVGSLSLLTLSASGLPLNIPGLVSLRHGGNPVTFIDPTFFLLAIPMPHDPTTHVTKWTFPTLGLRGTLHFQALMIDALNMHFMPIRTTTKDEVTLY